MNRDSAFQAFCERLFPSLGDDAGSLTVQGEDYSRIVSHWQRTFATQLHKQTGEWRLRGFDWHLFTYGYAEALEKQPAIDAYAQLQRQAGFVFTHAVKHPICCRTTRIPDYPAIVQTLSTLREYADIYVTDAEFRWTFVVTHETSAGIGPFFAYARQSPNPKRI